MSGIRSRSKFAAMKWRLGEITPARATAPPGVPRLYEITSVWESAESTTFADGVTIPIGVTEPGHTYRVRVRMQDNTGRWSHWSAPIEFPVGK